LQLTFIEGERPRLSTKAAMRGVMCGNRGLDNKEAFGAKDRLKIFE